MFPDVDRLGEGDPGDLVPVVRPADDLVPLDLEPGDDPLRSPGEQQRAEQLAVGGELPVELFGLFDAGPEELLEEAVRHVDRRDVVDVGAGAVLRVERQGELADLDDVVERVVLARLAAGGQKAVQADLADAGLDAQGDLALLDPRVAADALFADPRDDVEEDLLVGTGADALLVAAAALLVDQDDAVLVAFVDRLARAGREAGRVVAVVADPGEVEHPHRVDAGEGGAHVDGAGDVVLADVGRRVVVDVRAVSVGRLFVALGLEDGRGRERRALPRRRAGLCEQAGVPLQGIAAVGLGLDVVPEDDLLALAAGPAGLAGDGAGLALDALVGVEDVGHLALGRRRLVGVVHLAAELPVVSLGHDRSSVLTRAGRRTRR